MFSDTVSLVYGCFYSFSPLSRTVNLRSHYGTVPIATQNGELRKLNFLKAI